MKPKYREYVCGVCENLQTIESAQFTVAMPVCERCGQKTLWRKVGKQRVKRFAPQGFTWESPTPPGFYLPDTSGFCPFDA